MVVLYLQYKENSSSVMSASVTLLLQNPDFRFYITMHARQTVPLGQNGSCKSSIMALMEQLHEP
jgi:hypothetical protein